MEILDKRRLDHHENYVCCSVQEMNSGFFKRRQAENLDTPFSEWAVLSIDPSVITDSALFCPVNAATGNGRYIQGGAAAFEGIFAPHLEWRKADGWQSLDRSYQRANQPTNNQAEVLIKDRIPRDKIIGVAFPASSYEVECKRMQFWYTGNIMKERLEGI